jgi:CheY-like chemotaxis protein
MKKIMIVDDEPDQILTLEYSIKNIDNDFEIIAAKDGKECLEKLYHAKELPDLILLDIMMPGMNGFEVYDNIKSDRYLSRIPIVFLTATGDKIEQELGKTIAEEFIMKPFDIKELLEKINRLINKK